MAGQDWRFGFSSSTLKPSTNKGDFAMNEKLFQTQWLTLTASYVHIVELESDELLCFKLAISSFKGCWTSFFQMH